MRAFATLAACVILILASGCSGAKASAADAGLGSEVQAMGEPLEDAGSIRASVFDDAALPIAGATVGIPELALQAVTDESGQALFTNLAPGSYQVAAATLGYSSAAKRVDVAMGAESTVTFTLVAIVLEVPSYTTFGPLAGYFDCRMAARIPQYSSWTGACGSVGTPVGLLSPPVNVWENDNSVLNFQLERNSTASVVGDMRWTPSAVGTSSALRFAFSYEGRSSTHWWCSGEGPSPQAWRWESDANASVCANKGSSKDEPVPSTHTEKGEPMTLRVYANTPFGTEDNPTYVTLQQHFEIMTTVFYVEPAPEGFFAFTDA